MLSYSNKDVLNIGIIETPIRCLNINSLNRSESKDIINSKLKYGTLMMKAIIAYASDNGFKKIHLDDISRFNCLDKYSKLSYSLLHVHILTDGKPWYDNFGFKFIDSRDLSRAKKNKTIIKNMITKDLPFDKLLIMIYQKLSKSEHKDLLTTELIISILKLYIKHKYTKLCEFLKELTKSHCHIMSFIYMDIYHYLKLELFETNTMELII